MTYRFKFGTETGWLEKWFHVDATKSFFEAHSKRGEKHTILYIYNDDGLWGTVVLTPELYKDIWERFSSEFMLCFSVNDLTNSNRPGYKTFCLLSHLKREHPGVFYDANCWLEQEYIKHALNHHQAAAGIGTAGPEDTEGSHRSATAQT